MSLLDWLKWSEQSESEKIVLVEMDIGRAQRSWYNKRAGVWAKRFYSFRSNTYHSLGHGNLGYGSLGGSGTFDSGVKIKPMDINTVNVDLTEYTKQGSLASVQANVSSFYYDYDTSELAMHCPNHNDPATKTVIVGFTTGYSNRAININNAYYEPLVLGVPVFSRVKDPLYFGIVRQDSGTIEMNNENGDFDSLADDYIFGQTIQIKYGGNWLTTTMAYADYQTMAKAKVTGLSLDYNKASIEYVSNIDKLERTVPPNKYDQTTFPNLNDDDLGKARPIAYGSVYHAPVVCTNKDDTGQDWIFEAADVTDHPAGISTVTAAYLDSVPLTIKSTSPTSGTFTVANANYDPASAHMGAVVTCDFQGFADEGALDIIKDLASVYCGIVYNSTNYDTTEWGEAAGSDYACGLFLNGERQVDELIGELCLSTFGVFIVKDDGRFTFRIIDTSQDPKLTIFKEDFLSGPKISHDGTQYLSSCKIGYKKDWNLDSFRWHVEDSDETEISTRYGGKKRSDNFESLLQTSGNASSLASDIMDYMQDVKPPISIDAPIKYITLEIGDIVCFEIERVQKSLMGIVKVEMLGVTKNIGLADAMDYTTLEGRFIQKYTSNLLFASPYIEVVDEYCDSPVSKDFIDGFGRMR